MKARAPQGQFRSISVVELDSPAFRMLGERQRMLLIFARLSLGPCGIAAVPGFFHLLADRSAIPVEAIAAEWAGLEGAGIAYFDGVTAWIVDGLDIDPGLSMSDWKHRVFVHRLVDGLPRCALVGAFVQRYLDWWDLGEKDGHPMTPPTFPAPDPRLAEWLDRRRAAMGHRSPSDGASMPQRSPSEGPSKGPARTDTETETEPDTESPPRARGTRGGWNEELLRAHLPETCHVDLRRVLVASRAGAPAAADAIAAMCGLDPLGIPAGAGMQPCSVEEMGGVINRMAGSKDPSWHQTFANRTLESIRREARRAPAASASGAHAAGAPSL